MRKIVTSKMRIVLVVCLLGGSLASEMSYKEQVVRDVFKEMLHISPPGSLPEHLIAPPRHMLELYNSYSKRRGVRAAAVNTVRNILPSKAPQELEAMSDLLFFNVSCIESKEEVRLGQLHLNRRRLHQRHHHKRMLAPPFRIRLFQVDGARIKTLGSIPVSQVARGTWQTVDITPALREILLDPDVPDKLLGVRFEAPKGKILSPHHFLRDSDEPPAFLVVFSEDSLENEVTDEGTVPSPEPPVHTHAIVQKLQSSKYGQLFLNEDPEDNYPDLIPSSIDKNAILKDLFQTSSPSPYNQPKDNQTTTKPPENVSNKIPRHNNTYYRYNRYMARQLPQEDNNVRVPRSVIDNEIPDVDSSLEVGVTEPSPEGGLQERISGNIPGPAERRGQKGRKGRRRRMKKKKNNQWKNANQEPGTSAECKVKMLSVDFERLGWEWIVAPKSFNANYCAGSCRFPLSKNLNATNHAVLQTILHYKGDTPEVPDPSCVPDKLAPITMLYYDSMFNLKLTNFQNMSVGSCTCR